MYANIFFKKERKIIKGFCTPKTYSEDISNRSYKTWIQLILPNAENAIIGCEIFVNR